MKRLVELDTNGYGREVDRSRLAREAKALLEFLVQLPPGELKSELTQRVAPFCQGALDGSKTFPIGPREKPINITREFIDCGRTLPAGFEELYARFFNTALGARIEWAQKVQKDGKWWAPMEFEET